MNQKGAGTGGFYFSESTNGDVWTETFRINADGTPVVNNAYTLPNTDGTSGQSLVTDGSGSISWGTPTIANDADWTISGANQYSAVAGNVGVGTGSPAEKLDVQGNVQANSYHSEAPEAVDAQGGYFMWNKSSTGATHIVNQKGLGAGGFYFSESTTGDALTEIFRINADGTPVVNNTYTLPNTDGTSGQSLVTDGSGSISWGTPTIANDADWTISGANQYSSVAGNVGVGANAPTTKLHIQGADVGGTAGNVSYPFQIQANASNANYLRTDARRHTTGADWSGTNWRMQRIVDVTPQGFIDFGIDGKAANSGVGIGSGTTTHMVVESSGNVGVGTTTPTAKLQVKGADLGGTAGDISYPFQAQVDASNNNYLRANFRRHTTGADWAGTHWRLQKTVDAIDQAFIDFGIDGKASNYGVGIGSAGVTHFVVENSGYVGVGTTSPVSKLQLSNNLATGALDNYSEYQLLLHQGSGASTSQGIGVNGDGLMVFNAGEGYAFGRGTTYLMSLNGDVFTLRKADSGDEYLTIEPNRFLLNNPTNDFNFNLTETELVYTNSSSQELLRSSINNFTINSAEYALNDENSNPIITASSTAVSINTDTPTAGAIMVSSDVNGELDWMTPSEYQTDYPSNGFGVYAGSGTTPSNTSVNITDNLSLADLALFDKTNNKVQIQTSKTLEVDGSFKLTSGSPANGMFLISDANGLASWKSASSIITDHFLGTGAFGVYAGSGTVPNNTLLTISNYIDFGNLMTIDQTNNTVFVKTGKTLDVAGPLKIASVLLAMESF